MLKIKQALLNVKNWEIGISESTREKEVHFVSQLVNYLIYITPKSIASICL